MKILQYIKLLSKDEVEEKIKEDFIYIFVILIPI